MRFGIFMAPFHPVGQNPTLALQRDLELIQRPSKPRRRAPEPVPSPVALTT